MQLQDQRHTVHTLLYDDLSQSEKDEYAKWCHYFRTYRSCSFCGVTFSLSRSLANGTVCPVACHNMRPRDHIDYNSEQLTRLDSIVVPYRLHLVLKSQGYWPEHKYIAACTKDILPENSTRQPEAVLVDRVRFVPGPLGTARLSAHES